VKTYSQEGDELKELMEAEEEMQSIWKNQPRK